MLSSELKNNKAIRYIRTCHLFFLSILFLGACETQAPPPIDPQQALIQKGEEIFLNETFNGNGRTCGTCHRPEDNFGLSPAFIATLPSDDPLFVAEINPALNSNFENPTLMREFALIFENQDGFGDLDENFNMRGVPHTLAMKTSIESRDGPRTGWSGDGSPGDGSLRSFAVGAVIQHFPKTLERVAGVDFRLPTEEELDAMEAFQLSLGRQQDLSLPLPLKGVVAKRGQDIFLDNSLGKCNACHFNAGANGNPQILGPGVGNINFNTGVEDLPDQPADLTGEKNPPDDGFGSPGIGEFNIPPLVEAADTGPFFHNNSVETIEGSVAFYNGESFNNSPAGQLIRQATGGGINLDATQTIAVAAFLRVINALENIRSSSDLIVSGSQTSHVSKSRQNILLGRAQHEIEDAIQVLSGGGLHPIVVNHLRSAIISTTEAMASSHSNKRERLGKDSLAQLMHAKNRLQD